MKDKQKNDSVQKKTNKNASSPKSSTKANQKQKKDEEAAPDERTEPVVEKVRKKIPKHKNLGPSGQEWDV